MTDDEFERLFHEYQAAVYGWIVRIVRDRGAAEDLTIETFWRIYKARDRFDQARSFGAWARRIATNCAVGHLKRSPFSVRGLPFEDHGERQTANEPALQHETRRNIVNAFNALPPKLRTAATLALIEEVPYDEIAAALHISVAAVKSRVFRATQKLRTRLQRMGIRC